jgi:hypothetical protein
MERLSAAVINMVSVAAAIAALAPVNAADAVLAKPKPGAARPPAIGSCTIAVPLPRATVEAEIANAGDFCELVSYALAGQVFHSAVMVIPGLLWHYADTTISCQLRYGRTRYWMIVRNSPAACRWLMRLAPRWHREPVAIRHPLDG